MTKVTRLMNTCGETRYFGVLRKALEPDEVFCVNGDPFDVLCKKKLNGKVDKRKFDALKWSIENGDLTIVTDEEVAEVEKVESEVKQEVEVVSDVVKTEDVKVEDVSDDAEDAAS